MKKISGYTLIELIVCLGVIGLLTTGIAGLVLSSVSNSNRRLFDTECQTILDEIIESRNAALMSADNYGVTLKIYSGSLSILQYQPDKNDIVTKNIRLKYGRMTHNFGLIDPVFSNAGVINKGGTITFYRNNRAEKYLVMQPVTGRIYLTDEKSN